MHSRDPLENKIEVYLKRGLLEYFHLPAGTDCAIQEKIVANYNINYIVRVGKAAYVLRVNVEQQSGLEKQIEYEYKTLEYLSTFGIVPRTYFMDNSRSLIPYDFLVQDFIEGEHVNFDDRKGIGDAARVLATLHTVPLPEDNFLCVYHNPLKDLYNELTEMFTRYKKRKSSDRKLVSGGSELLKELEKEVPRYEMLFTAESIVHTDCVNDNFIRSPREIKIVDWEKPRVDDATYDICVYIGRPPQIWISPRVMTEQERDMFLQEYCAIRKMDKTLLEEKIHVRQPFVSFRWILWGAHRTADADEGTISPELFDFHLNHYERYKRVCAVENVEHLLTKYFT